MSGHNKWSKIKRKKEVIDAKKSKLFGSLIKTIQIEAAKAGGDRNAPSLKAAITRAREANLPNQNIERAIAAAEKGGQSLEMVRYEAYGPGGSALIIEGSTDNKNRTAQAVKQVLGANEAQLAEPGAASWAFDQLPGGKGWVAKNKRVITKEDQVLAKELIEALLELSEIERVAIDVELEP